MFERGLQTCDCLFSVVCPDGETAGLVKAAFGGLVGEAAPSRHSARRYVIARSSGGYTVSEAGHSVALEDEDSLLFHLDKEMILVLQHERRDLLFLHAAAVASGAHAAILSAASGTGKSTLTLASLQHGLEYLSDELAPIDLQRLTVHAYPHALCLKSPPPAPYGLPDGTVLHGGRYQIPVEHLPGGWGAGSRAVLALVFLERNGGGLQGLRPITHASAVARLMANTLNSLAHDNAGLDATVAVSEAIPSYELDIADLARGAAALKGLLSGV